MPRSAGFLEEPRPLCNNPLLFALRKWYRAERVALGVVAVVSMGGELCPRHNSPFSQRTTFLSNSLRCCPASNLELGEHLKDTTKCNVTQSDVGSATTSTRSGGS